MREGNYVKCFALIVFLYHTDSIVKIYWIIITYRNAKFAHIYGHLLSIYIIYGNTAQKKVPYIAKCDIINLWINR